MDSFGRKRKYNYNHPTNRSTPRNNLVPGLQGFLCTCNFREKDCVRESYNLLNEYADSDKEEAGKVAAQSANPEIGVEDDLDGGDIQDKLDKELETLRSDKNKKPSERRFQVVDSGAKNCIFIRTTIQEPVKLVHNILKDLEATQKPKTRFLIRLLPIETTCKAFMEDIKNSADLLFTKYFTAEGKTFSIVYNCRNNQSITRDVVIDEFAKMIVLKNPANRVDLKQPELAVLVEIIRNVCCISVLPDYYKFRKYNLLEVSGCTEGKNPQKPCGDGNDPADPEKVETEAVDGTADSCTELSEPVRKTSESGDSDEAT